MDINSSKAHRGVQHSTTLNRKYVKRPKTLVSVKKAAPAVTSLAKLQSENLARRQALAEKINREKLMQLNKAKKEPTKIVTAEKIAKKEDAEKVEKHPIEIVARQRIELQKSTPIKEKKAMPSMKEQKDQAIKSALKSVATMEKEEKKTPKMKSKSFFNAKRIILALSCAAIAVGAITYFVNLGMPNFSVRVAAIQTGIDAVYPSYIPRDYALASVMSENGKVSMTFQTSSGNNFVLTEEKSSWDSAALETNYVKLNYIDYTPIREQGLTLYISGSNCAWVNGGKVFTITTNKGELTKKQLKSIAVSL